MKKTENLLSKVAKKIEIFQQEEGAEMRKNTKTIKEALKGLKILKEILNIPEVCEYSHHEKIYVAKGGFGSYNIIIKSGNIITAFSLDDSFPKELDENRIKSWIDQWEFIGTEDEKNLTIVLGKIFKLGYQEILKRILEDITR